MAVEWYLMKSPHSQLSGFEDDALNDFAREGFEEALESEMAVDIELCNYDLSVCFPMRALVQNRTQDTKLQTLTRHFFLPIGTCKAGMYIKYKDRYWLIVGLVDDNSMYEKAIVVLCNYLLTWLNDKKKVVQRWANVTSASQYNNGETSTQFMFVRSDQLLILTPDDRESLLLSTGKRFIIDKRCSVYEREFPDDIVCDTSKEVITYKQTRSDSVLYNYNDSGHYELMVYQDEQHPEDGYYMVDGKGYWLCEKPYIEDKNAILLSKIEYDSLEIYNALEPCIYVPRFYDIDGNEIDIAPQWNINCDFANQLLIEHIGNSICISSNDRSLINKSFELSLGAEGYETVSITITIRSFI